MHAASMDWEQLLNGDRFGKILGREKATSDKPEPEGLPFLKGQFRTEQERDHDRVYFRRRFGASVTKRRCSHSKVMRASGHV